MRLGSTVRKVLDSRIPVPLHRVQLELGDVTRVTHDVMHLFSEVGDRFVWVKRSRDLDLSDTSDRKNRVSRYIPLFPFHLVSYASLTRKGICRRLYTLRDLAIPYSGIVNRLHVGSPGVFIVVTS